MDQRILYFSFTVFDEGTYMANQRSVHLPEGEPVSHHTKRRYKDQETMMVSEMRKWCNAMPYYDFYSQAAHDEFVRVFAAEGHNKIVQKYLQSENSH
jgi:hypothetical protein